ncbi:hypothetical protein FXF53_12190 [Micromonospora sp. WP24]|uniref:hypothetical protein n=1 Tax=Micromonospora sp. WP24 TaxID=2604469 RepID=UPI0011D88616|nr:hypothetical protein [Micromonospora sp. WP24]TYC01235.1 hypothetical protein FXF53_12190 [Micromonospora sp. WP24]
MSILSPQTAERVEPALIQTMVAEGLARYEPDPSCWYSVDGLPYGYDIQAPGFETDPEELDLVERAAGATMACAIGLHIFVSDVAGRPTLARTAQQAAQRTDGWVFVEFHHPPSPGLLKYLDDAGRCLRLDDAVYLDAAAMTAWITHPDFHVVK